MTRRYAFYFFAPVALWLVEALVLPWSGPVIRLAEPLLLFGFYVAVRERLAPALAVILWTAVLYQTISAPGSGIQIAVIALAALLVRKILHYFLGYGFFATQTRSYH